MFQRIGAAIDSLIFSAEMLVGLLILAGGLYFGGQWLWHWFIHWLTS